MYIHVNTCTSLKLILIVNVSTLDWDWERNKYYAPTYLLLIHIHLHTVICLFLCMPLYTIISFICPPLSDLPRPWWSGRGGRQADLWPLRIAQPRASPSGQHRHPSAAGEVFAPGTDTRPRDQEVSQITQGTDYGAMHVYNCAMYM